jgi:hypothetical protein
MNSKTVKRLTRYGLVTAILQTWWKWLETAAFLADEFTEQRPISFHVSKLAVAFGGISTRCLSIDSDELRVKNQSCSTYRIETNASHVAGQSESTCHTTCYRKIQIRNRLNWKDQSWQSTQYADMISSRGPCQAKIQITNHTWNLWWGASLPITHLWRYS